MYRLQPHHEPFFSGFKITKKLLILLICFAILLLILLKHFFWDSKPAIMPVKKVVEIETLKNNHFEKTIRLLGTVHAKHRAILTAQGNGTFDALVPTGQKVEKGTLIAKIDNPDLENNLQLSVHAEAMAKAQYERMEPLLKKGFVSPAQLEEKKQGWIEAQKNVSTAKMALDNLRFYAPFDGFIGAYKKREGAHVRLGDMVVSMYDPAELVVDFNIPCSNLNAISPHQRVYIAGKKYQLNYFQSMLDEDTHMCPADVNIVCENCLLGSTIEVQLVVAEKQNTLNIPFEAFFLRNGQPFVYLVKEGKIALVPVKTGMQQENRIEILEGLHPGEQLVIKGQERLFPDMPVEIYNAQAG